MSRHSAVVILALAAAAGCASSGTQTPATQRTIAIADGQVMQASEVRGSNQQFDAPATQVWTALASAYKSLGIDVPVNDPSTHRMGNTQFHVSGRFNGQPLSAYADCGIGPTGPRANGSRVYFSVITTVTAVDATHTKLSTDVEPVAVDMTGTTNARLDCGTTGQLETELYNRVRAALAGTGGGGI
ncbi:MAG TPA: hypothetical protein VF737_12495 [Gemmatimonadaceae bacterium]